MNKQANTTAKKLFHSSTFWTLLIVSVLLAFSGGYATGNLNTDSGEIKQVSQGDDMANMSSPGVYEVPEDVEAPRVTNLEVTKDNKAGWNISFDTENFTFTPENASSPHIPNEGHAHLHIDGKKISRLYSNNYYVADLEPGDHTFSVYLNTNDHKEYVVDGVGTGQDVVVTQ